MSLRKTLATSHRVLAQLRHDRRTLALLFVVPPLLLVVLKYVFDGDQSLFNQLAPMMLGIFPMILMFLVTSVTTLRERTGGTLNRLMTMPIGKADFIFGYALAFSLLGLVQAAVASVVLLGLLKVTVAAGTLPTLLGAVFASFLGTALGLFTSAFARSEFQAIQFMPAFIFPQLLTCGLFTAREHMAKLLQWLADIFPLTYSVDAMKQVTLQSSWTATLSRDLVIVAAFGVAALVLASITIRRQD